MPALAPDSPHRQARALGERCVAEQVEVLAVVGNNALESGEGAPEVHAHVVVGRSDGTMRGRHVLEAHVWPTLEAIVVESPQHLRRRTDPETGLALLGVAW